MLARRTCSMPGLSVRACDLMFTKQSELAKFCRQNPYWTVRKTLGTGSKSEGSWCDGCTTCTVSTSRLFLLWLSRYKGGTIREQRGEQRDKLIAGSHQKVRGLHGDTRSHACDNERLAGEQTRVGTTCAHPCQEGLLPRQVTQNGQLTVCSAERERKKSERGRSTICSETQFAHTHILYLLFSLSLSHFHSGWEAGWTQKRRSLIAWYVFWRKCRWFNPLTDSVCTVPHNICQRILHK